MTFIFGTEPLRDDATYARVPPGIKGKLPLIEALRTALRFPEFCGSSWDSLEECIRDLSWIPTGTVVLIHDDLPLSNNRGALHTYLSILHDAAAKLDGGHDRNLVVVFPVDAKGLVMEALTHE
jgi:hypothetical protein